jgi:hypothetical protein
MSYPPTGGNYDTLPTNTRTDTASKPRMMKPVRGFLRPRTQSTRSLLDEIIPTPTSPRRTEDNGSLYYLARRTGSVAVISIFLLSIIFLASTEGRLRNTGADLRKVFGSTGLSTGDVASTLAEQPEQGVRPHPVDGGYLDNPSVNQADVSSDFEKYIMLRTVESSDYKLSKGHRLIFIGDVHGSYDPLQ